MNKIKRNLVFYVVLTIAFYGIPWAITDTGSAMFMMLVIIPIICFMTSVMYGLKNGFSFSYVLIASIIFIPTIYIFYNSTAWIYVIAYSVIAILGNLTALPFRKG